MLSQRSEGWVTQVMRGEIGAELIDNFTEAPQPAT